MQALTCSSPFRPQKKTNHHSADPQPKAAFTSAAAARPPAASRFSSTAVAGRNCMRVVGAPRNGHKRCSCRPHGGRWWAQELGAQPCAAACTQSIWTMGKHASCAYLPGTPRGQLMQVLRGATKCTLASYEAGLTPTPALAGHIMQHTVAERRSRVCH